MQSRRPVHAQVEASREARERLCAEELTKIWLAAGLDATNVLFSQHKGLTKCKVEIHGTPSEVLEILRPGLHG